MCPGLILFVKGIKLSQGSIIDLEHVRVVACYLEEMLGHLQSRLDNLRVNDLILLRSSHLSLTVIGMSLLLEGLSMPSFKCMCSTWIICL